MIVDLFYAVLSFEIFIFSILAHELGHLIAFRHLGIKPKLEFQKTDNSFRFIFTNISEFKTLHPLDKIMVYLYGVGIGWITLFVLSSIFKIQLPFMVFWIVVYIIGCKSDLKNMIRLIRND